MVWSIIRRLRLSISFSFLSCPELVQELVSSPEQVVAAFSQKGWLYKALHFRSLVICLNIKKLPCGRPFSSNQWKAILISL